MAGARLVGRGLLAVWLVVSFARLGAAAVRTHFEVLDLRYALGAALTMINMQGRALIITREDLEVAVWALEQRRPRRGVQREERGGGV
jgi:hypothetical protein